jgi:hypothetical protein
MAEETVNVNPDGSTTFEGSGGATGEESTMPPVTDPGMEEETLQEIVKGTDPAIYLLLAAVLIGFLYFLYTRKARADVEDEFFASLEEEKVSSVVQSFFFRMTQERVLLFFLNLLNVVIFPPLTVQPQTPIGG